MDSALERSRDRFVLGLWLGRRPEARVLGAVGDVRDDLVRHLARDREDRALGGLAYRGIGAVGCLGERRADQRGVDQLPGAAHELLSGAADQLREDHPGVAARAEQRRAGDRLNDLLTPNLIDRALLVAALQAIELIEHRTQGQRHIVARVSVGYREDVEVVDLLAARFEMRERSSYCGTKTDQIGIGHGNTSISLRG